MVLLLNWLWQGSLLTAGVAAALGCTRRLNASTRERIWWITLVAVLLLPLVTLVGPAGNLRDASVAVGTTAAAALVELPEHLPVWTSVVWALWLAWAMVWFARLAGSLVSLSRTARRVTAFPRSRERSLHHWSAISGADGVDSPRLVVSADVAHAAVVGLVRPVIAISPVAARTLSSDELDQLVVHEYAHVRRRDHVAILLQRIAWAVAGIHPAVWWIDRALTLEREVACDDWVIAHAATPKAYGSCLVKLAEQHTSSAWSAAPGVSLSRSHLAVRVVRLLDPLRNVSLRPSPMALLGAALAIALAATAGAQLHVFGHAAAPAFLRSIAMAAGVMLPDTQGSRLDVQAAAYPVRPSEGRDSVAVQATPPVSQETDIRDAFDLQVPPAVEFSFAAPEPVATMALDTHGASLPAPALVPARHDAERRAEAETADDEERSAWMRVADAGVAVGDGARSAGVKTGGFFTRVGKGIAGAF